MSDTRDTVALVAQRIGGQTQVSAQLRYNGRWFALRRGAASERLYGAAWTLVADGMRPVVLSDEDGWAILYTDKALRDILAPYDEQIGANG